MSLKKIADVQKRRFSTGGTGPDGMAAEMDAAREQGDAAARDQADPEGNADAARGQTSAYSEYGMPGPSSGVYGGSIQYGDETIDGGAQRTEIGKMMDKLGELSPSQQRALSALPGGAVISGLLSLADKTGAGWTGGNNTRGRGSSGDPGENGDRRPGDTASDVKPFGSDAPTGTTKMEDEKGTGEKKYRWDPKLRQYVLENLGAGANPMGYRQGQVFQMAQGGLAAGARARRSFAKGGVTELPEDRRVKVIAYANTLAQKNGTTVLEEINKYLAAEGFSQEEGDIAMAYPPGTLAGTTTTGTTNTGTGGGVVKQLDATQIANVKKEAERRAGLSGKSAEEELYRYTKDWLAEHGGGTMADLDTWMGYPAGTSQWWADKFDGAGTGTNTGTVDLGENMKLPDGYVDPYTTPLPYLPKDETVDTGDTGTVDTGDTGTVDTGDTGTVDTGGTKPPALDPFGGLEAFNPEDRAAVVAEARRLAGLSGRTPERELYNFATQKSGLGSGQIDRLMGYDPGTTDYWWAQQAGGGRDALANGGGGYGGGGSNFNNGGLDGLGIKAADGTRTLLGGVNDNAYDPRQYGWRTGLQAAAPAQPGPYIRGMAAGGIAAGAPAPRFVSGGGTGLSDEVPVTMDDGGEGRLADGEFVITADVVSGLGGGSSKAGAKMLYDMMERVRQQAHGSKKQIRPVDPKRVLPA